MHRMLLGCALAATAWAQAPTPRAVGVDASRRFGQIRSLQGVNDGPYPLMPGVADVTQGYRDVRVDIVRLHDYFGPADIDARWPDPDPIAKAVKADASKTIFPDWNADPEKESSYNFGPSDRVIQAIVNAGAQVYFRIGRSWSADPAPPADFDKYANLVKHVAMHYNDGWDSGFHDKIRYWEIWNEPDVEKNWAPAFVREFWTGTPQQFYEMFGKIVRTLKAYDPHLMVGGPAKARGDAAGPYREGLLDYLAAHKVPLDFYSWHHYADRSGDPYDYVRIAKQTRALLNSKGFPKAESYVTEWNIGAVPNAKEQMTMAMAAFNASALIYMHDAPLERAFLYRGDAGTMGLFESDGAYRPKAYAFKAVSMMQDTPLRLLSTGADEQGFAVLSGVSRDRNTVQVLISNYEIPERLRQGKTYANNRAYALKVTHLPWGKAAFTVKRFRTTETDKWVETASDGKGGTAELNAELPPPGIDLVVIRKK
jgi:xylan 1,4-beta-xylosidase